MGGGEKMPWCDTCEAISVPLDDGTCGDCCDDIRFKTGAE